MKRKSPLPCKEPTSEGDRLLASPLPPPPPPQPPPKSPLQPLQLLTDPESRRLSLVPSGGPKPTHEDLHPLARRLAPSIPPPRSAFHTQEFLQEGGSDAAPPLHSADHLPYSTGAFYWPALPPQQLLPQTPAPPQQQLSNTQEVGGQPSSSRQRRGRPTRSTSSTRAAPTHQPPPQRQPLSNTQEVRGQQPSSRKRRGRPRRSTSSDGAESSNQPPLLPPCLYPSVPVRGSSMATVQPPPYQCPPLRWPLPPYQCPPLRWPPPPPNPWASSHTAVDNQTITAPLFVGASNQIVGVPNLQFLLSQNITRIDGEIKCIVCRRISRIELDLRSKFEQVSAIVKRIENDPVILPKMWVPEERYDHGRCVRCMAPRECLVPVFPERMSEINWLFLMLGQMLDCCRSYELEWFCEQIGVGLLEGVPDRKRQLLYWTYLGLCLQLDPQM